MKYEVLEFKAKQMVNGVETEVVEHFKDDKGVGWDAGSNITEMQISKENADAAIVAGKLKMLEDDSVKPGTPAI